MAHLCVLLSLSLSLSLYLGWASDALAAVRTNAPPGTHFKLAHATTTTCCNNNALLK